MSFVRLAWPRRAAAGLILAAALIAPTACGIPVLEDQQCRDSRETLREFYSLYLGTPPEKRQETWSSDFQKYIRPDAAVYAYAAPEIDPFWNSAQPPRSFRIAKCTITGSLTTTNQVQLFWRDDTAYKSEQKEVMVDSALTDTGWQITAIRVPMQQ